MKPTLKLEGDKALRTLLAELPKRVKSKGLRAAVTAASQPVMKAAKAKAPRQSGALKRSIGRKIVSKKQGGNVASVAAIIGARSNVTGEYRGRKRVPSRYIHLVAKGTSRTPANDFLDEAYRANAKNAEQIAAAKLQEVVEKEARKLGKL